MVTKIKSFTELNAWQEPHQLAVRVYKLVENFSKQDSYGLRSQTERSSLSISSDIAEGFGRKTKKHTIHFFIIVRGLFTELQTQLLLARDTNKITTKDFDSLAQDTTTFGKLIGGLLKSVNKVRKD